MNELLRCGTQVPAQSIASTCIVLINESCSSIIQAKSTKNVDIKKYGQSFDQSFLGKKSIRIKNSQTFQLSRYARR